MIALRLNADTSDAQRNIGALGNSIEELQRKLKAAQDAGNWGEAAKITQDIAFMQNPGFSVVGGGNNGGNGSNLQNTTQYNNARQLDIRLETITRVITTLTEQLKESTEKGQSKESFNLSAALNNAEQERRQLEAEKKRLETADRSDSSVMDMIKKYGVSRYLTQGLNYANQIAGIGFNHRIAMANGDYLGADVAAVESGAGIAQGIGGSLLGAGLMLGATPVGWGLMAAGGIAEIGSAIAKYWAGDTRADIAEGEAYRKTLAGTNGLNKLYTNGGTWLENSNKTDAILRNATSNAEGTGLSTDEFLQLATNYSRFGSRSSTDAMKQARDIALWAQSTGTDAGLITNFLGTARRYGDNSDVLGYASQARQAAGLTKAQNEEFLQSLQSVIEDGIANGYVKSAEDVSKTFVMFSRLSNNNPLWQGEQGAKRLAQMNSGIASATALQSVSDVIIAGAARDVLSVDGNREKYLGNRASGTYIDEMLLMEQGNNPAMFGAIAKSVKELEGGNYAARVERFKDIFKLNYAGAVDVAAMADKIGTDGYTEQDFANEVAKMQKDRNYQSEETKWQDDINHIAADTALMAKSKFWQNIEKLEEIAGKESTKTTTGNPDITKKAMDSASNPEVGKKIAKSLEEENTIDMESLETPIYNNVVTALVADKAAEYGDYGGAVRALITDEAGLSFATRAGYRIGDDSVFARLYSEGEGNDELDGLTMDEIGKYAALGYKKGVLFGIGGHKADGKVSESEVDNAIRKMQKDKDIKSAYESGNTDSYLAALRTMLRDLFGDITITSD